MKEYRYPLSQLVVSSIGPAVLMVGMLLWAVQGWLNMPANLMFRLVFWVVPVILLSTFVGLHQPTRVVIDEEAIRFGAFGREHIYRWKDVRRLRLVKAFLGERYYVQIGEPGLFRGRYWIGAQIEGYQELIAFLQSKERQISPSRKNPGKKGV